ncbi:glycosyltransferase [Pseudactinotalea suaedae]|uniref:glycosyltransferase n=1 Tax=Pseudactinotalea suaedae TaxID=1524924 RepID=UPI0012E26430|nr:glycosyltransferase [Pseudactinotalea suaedae]
MGIVRSALDGVFRLRAARAAGRAAWRVHLLVPTRADVLVDSSRQIARVYAERGHHEDAAAVLRLSESQANGSEARTQLAAARALAELDGGVVPEDLATVVEQTLTEADRHLEGGEIAASAARLADALALSYHPARHFGTAPSPLLSDHRTFFEPFERSSTFQALLGDPRPRPRPTRQARTERLLVLGYDNRTFIEPLAAEYRSAGVEVRVLDLAADPGLRPSLSLRSLVEARLRYGLDGARPPLPEHLADDVAWADTVFVEWGHRALVWASLVRGIEAPLVTRLHRYEAMTPMPLLTAWSSVERAVFVAPAIRAVVEATAPAITRAGTEVHVVPNRLELARCARDKLPGAERTLALIGWNKVVKDPAWALDVLAALRVTDDRWRLLLVGEEKPSDSLEASFDYHEDLTKRIVKLRDAVEVTGFSGDVPGLLQQVGVILSTSRFEGTHEALLEGVASGALPVVRNWPALRPWGGAASLYPPEWVVDSPQAAAARILAAQPSPPESAAARSAQRWALSEMDWDVVRPEFDAVVLEV